MTDAADMRNAESVVPVLALNAGSSSLKFGFYQVGAATADAMLSGSIDFGEGGQGTLHARDASGNDSGPGLAVDRDPQRLVIVIQDLLQRHALPAPVAIGHRIVHGGVHVRRHCLVDAAVLERLQAASEFAPLHVPPALALLGAAQHRFPSAAQVACVDTAFHIDLPEVARTLPIPRELRAQGIQRYGFHGLSCESIVRQLGHDLPPRVVIAHLGNGASLTAVANGQSIDTSMGLTPSGGVIMGTRCGDLDPGLLVYLLREKRFDAAQLEDLIDHRSGLLGISAIASDMRELHAASANNSDARLAIEMFCYSVRKQIAAMAAALDGIDLLVFTGGIGEHDAEVRGMICKGLSWLVILDDAGTADQSKVCVVPTREEQQIAIHAGRLASAIRQIR